MIKNIIFDMDGTILNTLDDICDSLNYTLENFGYRTLDIETVKGYVGSGIIKLIERALPTAVDADKFADIYKVMTSHYTVNMNNKTAPYDGILETMAMLMSKGIGMAVVSNKYDNAVRTLTKELFGEYITIAIGEGNGIPPKPQPQGVYKALELLDATADNSVYIGDSEVDFLTASNSGLTFIGVTWGFRSEKFLKSLGAQYLAREPKDIVDILTRIK